MRKIIGKKNKVHYVEETTRFQMVKSHKGWLVIGTSMFALGLGGLVTSRPVSADVVATSTSSSAVRAETTSASSSSAVNAETTSASSASDTKSAVSSAATVASSSSAVKAETASASNSSAANAETTGASSSSAVNADSTSANNSSAVNAETTGASSSSAVNADSTGPSSGSAVNAETPSAKTRQNVTKISYNTLLQQLPTSKALATDKEVITHVTKDNFLAYFLLNGSATYDQNTGIVTITPDNYNKVGNFSLKSKIDMNTGFTLTGKVNLGSNPNGADGIGFAFHNGNTTDIGNAGGNLGIGGLQDALGFKLDTWSNGYQAPLSDKDGSQIDSTNSNDFGWNGDSMNAPYGTFVDTENKEVATKDGKKVQRWWAKDVDGTSQALSKSDVNGQFHDFTIDYDGDTRTLAIKYTQTSGKILTWTRTISNSNQAMAMIVSASTGGAKNLQQFEIMSFDFKQAATVNVKYVDTKGNQIAQGEVTYPNGANVNGTYTTGQLEIPGYTFIKMGDGSLSASGTLTQLGDNGTVTYVYTKNPVAGGNVTAKYVDENGNPIADNVVSSGNVGDPYSTTQKDVPGYTFKEVQGNPTGSFTDQDQTVIYVYTKNPVTDNNGGTGSNPSGKPGNGTDTGNSSSNQPGNPSQPSNTTNNGVINTSTNTGSKVNNGVVSSPKLPQTGENSSQSQTMSFVGILLAMFGGLLGFLGIKKRRND